MSAKRTGWWRNPQAIISVLVGIISIGSWVVSQIVANAKQEGKIERTEEKVNALDKTVTTHSAELGQAETKQQLIEKDLEYLKQQNASILEAIKQRR